MAANEQNYSGSLEVKNKNVAFAKVIFVKEKQPPGFVTLRIASKPGTLLASMTFNPKDCQLLSEEPHLTLMMEDKVSMLFKVSGDCYKCGEKVTSDQWNFTFDEKNAESRKKIVDWFRNKAGISHNQRNNSQNEKKKQGKPQGGSVTKAHKMITGMGFPGNPFKVGPSGGNTANRGVRDGDGSRGRQRQGQGESQRTTQAGGRPPVPLPLGAGRDPPRSGDDGFRTNIEPPNGVGVRKGWESVPQQRNEGPAQSRQKQEGVSTNSFYGKKQTTFGSTGGYGGSSRPASAMPPSNPNHPLDGSRPAPRHNGNYHQRWDQRGNRNFFRRPQQDGFLSYSNNNGSSSSSSGANGTLRQQTLNFSRNGAGTGMGTGGNSEPPSLTRRQRVSHALGFQNLGNTCYVNAVLQAMMSLDSFCISMLKFPHGYIGGPRKGKGKEENESSESEEEKEEDLSKCTPQDRQKLLESIEEKKKRKKKERLRKKMLRSLNLPPKGARPDPLSVTPKKDPQQEQEKEKGGLNSSDSSVSSSESGKPSAALTKYGKAPVCEAFRRIACARLQAEMDKRESLCDPGDLKDAVAKSNSEFSGYGQQDAQEFFLRLVDLMHDELRRFTITKFLLDPSRQVVPRRPDPPPETREEEGQGQQMHEVVRRMKDLPKEELKLLTAQLEVIPTVDSFTAQERRDLLCIKCKHERHSQVPIRELPIDLPWDEKDKEKDDEEGENSSTEKERDREKEKEEAEKRKKKVRSLEWYLDQFFLEHDVDVTCEQCGHKTSRMKPSLALLPGVLVLHLKRFFANFEKQRYEKIHTPVTIPAQLDMGKYFSPPSDSSAVDLDGSSDISMEGAVAGGAEEGADRGASTFEQMVAGLFTPPVPRKPQRRRSAGSDAGGDGDGQKDGEATGGTADASACVTPDIKPKKPSSHSTPSRSTDRKKRPSQEILFTDSEKEDQPDSGKTKKPRPSFEPPADDILPVDEKDLPPRYSSGNGFSDRGDYSPLFSNNPPSVGVPEVERGSEKDEETGGGERGERASPAAAAVAVLGGADLDDPIDVDSDSEQDSQERDNARGRSDDLLSAGGEEKAREGKAAQGPGLISDMLPKPREDRRRGGSAARGMFGLKGVPVVSRESEGVGRGPARGEGRKKAPAPAESDALDDESGVTVSGTTAKGSSCSDSPRRALGVPALTARGPGGGSVRGEKRGRGQESESEDEVQEVRAPVDPAKSGRKSRGGKKGMGGGDTGAPIPRVSLRLQAGRKDNDREKENSRERASQVNGKGDGDGETVGRMKGKGGLLGGGPRDRDWSQPLQRRGSQGGEVEKKNGRNSIEPPVSISSSEEEEKKVGPRAGGRGRGGKKTEGGEKGKGKEETQVQEEKKMSNGYELRAAVCHQGETATHGHYVCLVKDYKGDWRICDDSTSRPLSEGTPGVPSRVHSSGYLLFFVRMPAESP